MLTPARVCVAAQPPALPPRLCGGTGRLLRPVPPPHAGAAAGAEQVRRHTDAGGGEANPADSSPCLPITGALTPLLRRPPSSAPRPRPATARWAWSRRSSPSREPGRPKSCTTTTPTTPASSPCWLMRYSHPAGSGVHLPSNRLLPPFLLVSVFFILFYFFLSNQISASGRCHGNRTQTNVSALSGVGLFLYPIRL